MLRKLISFYKRFVVYKKIDKALKKNQKNYDYMFIFRKKKLKRKVLIH